MAIDKKLNGENLTGNRLWIEDWNLEVERIERTARIGVDYAGEYRNKPWRFYVHGNPHVSRVKTAKV
jgi:DNA-3-methyladenine glycosylase